MGNCMSGDPKPNNFQSFKKDRPLQQKYEIYEPLSSTLFNTMRRHHDLVTIFVDSTQAKNAEGVTLDDVKALPAKSIKVMYSFKKLLIVGDYKEIKEQILALQKSANLSSVYVISERQYNSFIKSYAIYASLSRLSQKQTGRIPILVFNSQQLLKPAPKQLQIFIHLKDQEDRQVYSRLKINSDCIIEPPSGEFPNHQEINYYIHQLKHASVHRICLLHKKSLNQNQLMQIILRYLISTFETSQASTRYYLSKSFPKVGIDPSELVNQQKSKSHKTLDQTSNLRSESKTNVDEFNRLFKQHQNQFDCQKTERAYNLLSKLLSNILANPENQQYRRVKGMNKQMEQLLTRNNSGTKLLKLAGFYEKDGFWVNELELKYLKILRTGMDLGYKNANMQLT